MATITTAELATALNTTPREARKFLRADAATKGDTTPGKGSRYAIEKKHLAGLKKRFAAWDEGRKAPKVDETDAPDVTDEVTPDEVNDAAVIDA